jgi:hypothetical protein
MKLLKWIFLILLFSSSKSYSQSKDSSGCWEAHTNYNDVKFTDNHYSLVVKKDSIEISINNINKYNYKFYREKKNKYFMLNEDKMILEERNVKEIYSVKIKYYYKKMRESVNEITTLEFKKC